jgi:N-acetyldiaminopimelate deacetylase
MPLDPVDLRRRIHQNPELMFEEYATTSLLLENISSLEGVIIHRPLETGLLAEYRVNDGPYILFRADIDALPIKEETGSPFASRNNFMHACGHDVHTSILYGFLLRTVETKPDRNILFMFQPGEEGGGGAEKFIKTRILSRFDIRNAFALHVSDEFDKGTVASTPGLLFASSYEVDFEFFGRSAHVAFPENGRNAFDALTLFIDRAKSAAKEEPEKTLFGYGKISAGVVRNIVPGYAKLEATIRTSDQRKSEQFLQKMVIHLNEIEEKTSVAYKVNTGALYMEVINDRGIYDACRETLAGKYGFIDSGYKMAGEDFGFIANLYPSFMFWLGTGVNERFGLHNPKFIPDNSVIRLGIEAFEEILRRR